MHNLLPALQVSLNIFGGLAVFLFAMNLLGNSLQNVVGTKIELILQKLTNKPYKGMLVGTIITFLTQSSSITVLTLIGLVNVGVLSLHQGIGILLGAEIGTTITAQLVTFKIGLMYFPFLILGILLSRHQNSKTASLGKVIFSFGLLFMGMDLMKHGASPIKNSPTALKLFQKLGIFPMLGIITGALFTGITSSSSATTSLVVALGATNSITLPTGIALIMGANIGTTFLELIAVADMSLTPKRIAIAQALINILGVIIIYPFLTPFSSLAALSSTNLARQIANAHTIFNVGSSIFFLFFVKTIVALTKKIAPGRVIRIQNGVKYLDKHLLSTPHIAITNATKEINRMGQITLSMFSHIKQHLKKPSPSFINAISQKEASTDHLYQEISLYLNLISQKELNNQTAYRLSQLTHGITDIERTADHLKATMKHLTSQSNHQATFSPTTNRSLNQLIRSSQKLYHLALKSFIKLNGRQAQQIISQIASITKLKKSIIKQSRIKDTIKKKRFQRAVHHIERAAHHSTNLAHITLYGA